MKGKEFKELKEGTKVKWNTGNGEYQYGEIMKKCGQTSKKQYQYNAVKYSFIHTFKHPNRKPKRITRVSEIHFSIIELA